MADCYVNNYNDEQIMNAIHDRRLIFGKISRDQSMEETASNAEFMNDELSIVDIE